MDIHFKKPKESEKLSRHFYEHGFVKIKDLFDANSIQSYKDYIENSITYKSLSASNTRTSGYGDLTSSIKAKDIHSLNFGELCNNFITTLGGNYEFKKILAEIVRESSIQTNNFLFEITPGQTSGIGWHVGYRSFSYIDPKDFAWTLWIPLDPITCTQRGGLRYISTKTLDGSFLFPFATWYFRELMEKGIGTGYTELAMDSSHLVNSISDYVERSVPKNMIFEDEFNLGDAFLFKKTLFHRSAPFEEGPLTSRKAMVFRFVSANSNFNKALCVSTFQHTYKGIKSAALKKISPEKQEKSNSDTDPDTFDLRRLKTNDPFFENLFRKDHPSGTPIANTFDSKDELEFRTYKC